MEASMSICVIYKKSQASDAMVSRSQAKPSHWLGLALASGLRFPKPSQASQAKASIFYL
jgi:hypothetical protein